MTVPEPEEPNSRKDARQHRGDAGNDAGGDAAARSHPGDGGPMDTDSAFAQIVAGWQMEPQVPNWPAEEDCPPDAEPSGPGGDHRAGPRDWSPPADPEEDDHYRPPEPPPFPAPRPRTLGGLLLLIAGILLLARPSIIGIGSEVGTPLGLFLLTAGIAWLVMGLRTGPPSEGWDDGARV